MKSRKLLALFLAIFMLASLVVPASAETITPETNVTNGIVGYDAALVETVDLTGIDDIKTYDANNKKDAYKITDVEGWEKFDTLVDAASGGSLQGKTVYLANDLNFENATIDPIGTFTWDGNANGYNPKSFSGVLDGQGHSIKNVTIQATTANEVANGFFGLFNRMVPVLGYDCGVKNLIIDSTVNFSVPSNVAAYSGGGCLVGTIQGANNNGDLSKAPVVEIYNVCNKADMSYSSKTASGLIAFAKCCKLTMKNCENQGDLTYTGTQTKTLCSAGVGGLLGSFAESGKAHKATLDMINCRNTGDITVVPETDVTLKIAVGGLVGELRSPSGNADLMGNISNSINNGNITVGAHNTGDWAPVGGILGFSSVDKTTGIMAIKSCINYGTIVNDGAVVKTKDGILCGCTGVARNDCVDAAGKADPTYNMVAKYYQMSNKTYKNTEDADCYSIRLIALHNGDLALLDSYAYDITIQYGDTTVQASTGALTSVRTEIAVDSKLGEGVTKISASALGADYVSAVRIDNIPTSIGKITVTIVPTMTKGETTTTAAPITFTVDPAVYNAQ